MDCVYVRHKSVKYPSMLSHMLTGANALQSLGQQCALVVSCYWVLSSPLKYWHIFSSSLNRLSVAMAYSWPLMPACIPNDSCWSLYSLHQHRYINRHLAIINFGLIVSVNTRLTDASSMHDPIKLHYTAPSSWLLSPSLGWQGPGCYCAFKIPQLPFCFHLTLWSLSD